MALSPSFVVLLALFAFCISSVLSAAVTTPLLPLTDRGQKVFENNDNIGCGGQVGCNPRGRSCFGPTCVATAFCNVSGICSNRRSNDRSCSNDYECKNSFCVSGVCQDRQYYKIGETCGIQGQCDFQGYCSCEGDSCVCKAKPSVGQPCDSTTGCSADSVCQTTTSVCVEMFSIASGAACSSTVECQPGLYCDGQCKDPGTPSYAACSKSLPSGAVERDQSLCNANEVCNCKDFLDGEPFQCVAPQTYTKSEANKLKAVHKCAQKKKCKDLTFYQDGELKICGACEAKYCSAIKGYYESYEDWRTCVNPYREMYVLCDYSLAPWISVVIGICLGILIIVLCMSVFLCGTK